MASASPLRDVHLRDLPLDVHARASQWHEALTREFALIAVQEDEHDQEDSERTVPARLVALVRQLNADYTSFSAPVLVDLEEARRRGEASIDVTFSVPAEAAEAVEAFDRLLDDADAYCRSGDLLTLAAPPELLVFRRWFLGEFVRQLGGAPPTPWPRFADPAA